MIKRNILTLSLIALPLFAGATLAQPALAAKCAGVETSIIDCDGKTGQDAVLEIIKTVIKILTGGIGVLAVGATIFGAILYTSSGNNPENIKKAKGIWMNVVIGLILFAFLVAITNFLIPGGVFG